MNIDMARKAVVSAGNELVKTGLIARTWGNVSCRIDSSRFAVTPSGIAYDLLRPKDIVIVNIEDLSYEGELKPSSEKGIHAEVYRQKPGINFVIHTHQANASVAGLLGKDIDIANPENLGIIGERAILASYGLPGTKKLKNNIAEALKQKDCKAVLMKHHGALCFGEGPEEAFKAAQALEAECQKYIKKADVSQMQYLTNSYRNGNEFVFDPSGAALEIDIKTGKAEDDKRIIPREAELHRAVYNARKDVNVIIGSSLPYIVSASEKFNVIKPVLDDFAQIIGLSVSSVGRFDGELPSKAVHALKGRNAVLINGKGALCCAGNEDDAHAVEIVLEKGCMAYCSVDNNAPTPISAAECALMRFVYKQKYSKKSAQIKE